VKTFAGYAEAMASINPGDGMLPAGGDCDPAVPLRRAGETLRHTDLASFAAAGMSRVTVREPRLRVLPLRGNTIITAAGQAIAADIERRGGDARLEPGLGLDAALVSNTSDALVAIGGTGSGRYDASVHALARMGKLAAHGIALAPGETAALGFSGARPVLLLPGRLDAALAVWLVVGRPMLAMLTGGKPCDPCETFALARKVASTVGVTELVPVRRTGDKVEPLASRYLPLSALTRSDGWILVPADSEGYPAGTEVEVRPWP
jgi:molybdopterin biosynthesis enzyme